MFFSTCSICKILLLVCYKRSLIGLNIVQTLYPCCLASRMQSVSFGKFRIVHTIIAYIRVCTALHNYLLQSLIDMRRETARMNGGHNLLFYYY